MINITPDSVINAIKEQVSCDLAGESVILNLKNSTYFGLNPVGSTIWSLIQEPRKVGEIVSTILQEYSVERDECEKDLLKLLEDLESNALIQVL